MISHNIQQRINAITATSFDLWRQHDKNGTEAVVGYFEEVLPALGKANGQYESQRLLDWVLTVLEQTEDEYLHDRAAYVLGKMGEVAANIPLF